MVRCVKLICLIFLLSTSSCVQVPEAEFYSAEGIVSIHAKSLDESDSWRHQHGELMTTIVSVETTEPVRGALDLSFYVQQPGTYQFWILGSDRSASEKRKLPAKVFDSENFLFNSFELVLPSGDEPFWFQHDRANEPLEIFFEKEGHYSILFESGGEVGFSIASIHLSLNGAHEPSGIGYPETRRYNMDPVLEKREHHVEIPPAWAFGVLLGTDHYEGSYFVASGIHIDALLSRDPSGVELQEHIKLGKFLYEPDLESQKDVPGYFGALMSKVDLSTLRDIHSSTVLKDNLVTRGFLLSKAIDLFNPEIKMYPAMWRDSGLSGYDHLKKQVEFTSNPHGITYEVPFLAALPEWFREDFEGEIDEELFIRWLQFSAFNSIMVLPYFSDWETDRSEEITKQLKKFTSLRHRLFPYIYSYTLRARTARVKPVTGAGTHTAQFMLGEAFLAAPIVEEGSDQRQVYFPAGTWYNYWDNTEYIGGQSWIVEAPLSEIPLFVKAGSIIPYRDDSGSVMQATNNYLTLDIYTGEPGSFRLYEDDGSTMKYREGEFSTTAFRYFEHTDYATFNIGAVVRGFEGRRSETSYTLRFKFMDVPVSVTANGESMPSGEGPGMWYYSEQDHTLIITWSQADNQRTEFYIQMAP